MLYLARNDNGTILLRGRAARPFAVKPSPSDRRCAAAGWTARGWPRVPTVNVPASVAGLKGSVLDGKQGLLTGLRCSQIDHWSRCSTDPAIRREVAINGPLVISLDHQSVPLDTDLLIEKAVTVR